MSQPADEIKTYQLKLQVLKNALIEERKKNQVLEGENTQLKTQIATLEGIVNDKEKENINISKEMYELKTTLDIELSRKEGKSNDFRVSNVFGNIFQKDNKEETQPINDEDKQKIIQITKANKELENENEFFKKQFEAMKTESENIQTNYETRIEELDAQIKQNEFIMEEKNNQLNDDMQRIEVMSSSLKIYETEKLNFDSQIKSSNDEIKKLEKQIIEQRLQLASTLELLTTWQIQVKTYTQENFELCNKVKQYKMAMADEGTVIQKFKCEKVGLISNTKVEITFGLTEDSEYVLLIQDEKKKQIINIETMEYMRRNESDKKKIDVSVFVSHIFLI